MSKRFYENLPPEAFKEGAALIERARENWEGIDSAAFTIEYQPLAADGTAVADKSSEWRVDVSFARPFLYREQGTGWMDYEYRSDGVFENSNQSGHTGLGPIDHDSRAYLDKFPLGLLQAGRYVAEDRVVMQDVQGRDRSARRVSSWFHEFVIDDESGELLAATYYDRGQRQTPLVRVSHIQYANFDLPPKQPGAAAQAVRLPVSYQYEWPGSAKQWTAHISYNGFNSEKGPPFDGLALESEAK